MNNEENIITILSAQNSTNKLHPKILNKYNLGGKSNYLTNLEKKSLNVKKQLQDNKIEELIDEMFDKHE